MKVSLIKKGLVFAVILLFFSVSVIPSTGTTDVKQSTLPTAKGDTLYVGGNGTGNYSTIQDAIDDANKGDTVYVYDESSPYLEPLVINKTINLIGENKYSTIIDGNQGGHHGCGIVINAPSVVITNFTFENEEWWYFWYIILKIHSNENQIINNIFNPTEYSSGIKIINGDRNLIVENNFYREIGKAIELEYSNNTIIKKNRFEGCYRGVGIHNSNNNTVSYNELYDSDWTGIGLWSKNNTISENIIQYADDNGIVVCGNKNTIYKNKIEYCETGIYSFSGDSLNITENTISNCKYGIDLLSASSNYVQKNNISDNEIGIDIGYGKRNIITYNNINYKNDIGIRLFESNFNLILNNNIFLNKRNAKLQYSIINKWKGNYWGEPRNFPKIIFGIGRIFLFPRVEEEPVYLYYPTIDIDWHPAQEPYDIPNGV